MADNTTLNTGTGGDTIATDDIGGVKHQLVKVEFGAADTATQVSTSNPFPVSDSGGSLTVDNAGTFAVQIAANSSVNVAQVAGTTTDTNSGVKSAGTQRVVLATDQPQLTNALKVDGSAVTQPVSGTVTANAGTGTFTTQPVPVNTISTVNSTAVVLAGGAAFTGTSEDISGYAIIFVTVFTSHASATDGLSLQQSSDGANWDITDTYTIPATSAGQGKTFSLNTAGKFFRLVYTNGATLQTSFRLQTVYKRFYSKPSSQRPGDGYSNEVDLEQANTFPMMWNGSTWDRLTGVAATGLKVNGSGVTQPVSGTVTANAGTGPFPVSDNAGSLTVDASAASFAVNSAQVSGTATSVNSGAKDAGTQRVILASDQTVVPVSDNAGSLTVDAPVGTPAFVRLSDGAAAITNLAVNNAQVSGTTTAVNAGTNSAGVQRVTLATDQTTLTNTFGNVGVVPVTAGGLSIFHLVSAATTNATNVKASAGQLYGWYIYNSNAAARKVAFHNTAGTPTAGASVSFSIVIPPTSAANVEFTTGIAFATGIGITTVTDLTDAGTTAVAASDLIINLFYK